jgi:hypothetical protein
MPPMPLIAPVCDVPESQAEARTESTVMVWGKEVE